MVFPSLSVRSIAPRLPTFYLEDIDRGLKGNSRGTKEAEERQDNDRIRKKTVQWMTSRKKEAQRNRNKKETIYACQLYFTYTQTYNFEF